MRFFFLGFLGVFPIVAPVVGFCLARRAFKAGFEDSCLSD